MGELLERMKQTMRQRWWELFFRLDEDQSEPIILPDDPVDDED